MPYSKTSLGADQAGGFSLSRRGKRAAIAVASVMAAAAAGFGIWSAVVPDQRSQPATSCVTVTVPGSIGGEVLRHCGQQAAAFCRTAYTGTLQGSASLTENARSRCELAGFTRARVAAG